MKRFLLTSIALLALATSAMAENSTVNLRVIADMPSLRDAKAKDIFNVTIDDAQVKTTLHLTCQSGAKGLILRKDEACAVTGTGAIINPTTKAEIPRVKYSGHFIVKPDGYTDGRTLAANYLSVGSVPASSDAFGGSMILKPEIPSAGAIKFGENIVAGLKKKAGLDSGNSSIIDERTDTVEFSNFSTPSSGLPSDKGCAWRGSAVYAYQTSSWFLKLEGDCTGRKYSLTGNMPWVDTDDGGARYDLTLMLPSAAISSDAALFAENTSNAALFAAADGISGTLNMKLGSSVTVQVDGQPEEVPSSIEANGTLTGQNVPVEVVRSMALVLGILSRTFFGS
jgi:hypothetical protein